MEPAFSTVRSSTRQPSLSLTSLYGTDDGYLYLLYRRTG